MRPRVLKDHEVRMRVTKPQKAAMRAAAEREGLTLSAWILQRAMREAKHLLKR